MGITCVRTYEKVGRGIRLEPESNTCILDEYGEYKSRRVESNRGISVFHHLSVVVKQLFEYDPYMSPVSPIFNIVSTVNS